MMKQEPLRMKLYILQTGRVQYDEARSFENGTIHTSNNWKLVEA